MEIKIGNLYVANGNFHTTKGNVFKVRLIVGQKIWVVGLMWHFTTAEFENTFSEV